jgi:hypothetical protein
MRALLGALALVACSTDISMPCIEWQEYEIVQAPDEYCALLISFSDDVRVQRASEESCGGTQICVELAPAERGVVLLYRTLTHTDRFHLEPFRCHVMPPCEESGWI